MTSVDLWGAGIGAAVYGAACRSLGWKIASVGSRSAERAAMLAAEYNGLHTYDFETGPRAHADLTIVATPPANHASAVDRLGSVERLIVVAPLASTCAEADRMIDIPSPKFGGFGWPLISAPATQEFMRRAPSVGRPTSMSMTSSRPLPDWGGYADGAWGGGALQFAGHDHIAFTLLLARFLGNGPPTAIDATMKSSADGVDIAADVTMYFADGFFATVHADWMANLARSEIQLSGDEGVLRIDGNPAPTLEHNGLPVVLPRRPLTDERLRPLHDAGLVDMLRTIEAPLTSSAPLPQAFTFEFGRDVCEVIAASYRSAGRGGTPVMLPFTGKRDATAIEHFKTAAAS